jgi:predicted nucleic acid-binding protein
MLGLLPLATPSDIVTPAIIAIVVAAVTSGVGAYFARPRTRAEADNLNATASVSMSAEARQWTQVFVQEAADAKLRAKAAEDRAEAAEQRVDELEAGLIDCYHLVRQMRDHYRRHDETPPALPVRLEALWRATGH